MTDTRTVYNIPFIEIRDMFQEAQNYFGDITRSKHSFLVTTDLHQIQQELSDLYTKYEWIYFSDFTKILTGAIDMEIEKKGNRYEIMSCYVSYDGLFNIQAGYFRRNNGIFFGINHMSWLTLTNKGKKMCKNFYFNGNGKCLKGG